MTIEDAPADDGLAVVAEELPIGDGCCEATAGVVAADDGGPAAVFAAAAAGP